MPTEYQEAYLSAAIAEMRRALEDPETDVPQHAREQLFFARDRTGISLEAEMLFGDLPYFIRREKPPGRDPLGLPPFAAPADLNPSTLTLRITPAAHATAWLKDPGQDELAQQPLTSAQQHTLDQYVSAALMAIKDAIPEMHSDEFAHVSDPDEIFLELNHLAQAFSDCTRELHHRLDKHMMEEDQDADGALLLADALHRTGRSATIQMELLESMHLNDPNKDR